MVKEFVKNDNTIWYNILQNLIKTYNNRYHYTIKMKPIDVSKKCIKITYTYDKTKKYQNLKLMI